MAKTNPQDNNDIAIKVEGVSKSFKLPHEKSGSIKGALLGWRKRKRGYENQHVLKDISFEIKKGEFFGIVGRNGSGKSTLLKLISQIYIPDKGSITVNGKLTPFIELGVGFNPELSGRDNVYLNGALLGFNREEMEAMYDEIVEFAELERFMDQKLKNYSSGMQVRLAFSIAIRANTDILVLDEVLAVGDAAFQQKCTTYFAKLKKEGKTVVLVTHDMDSVQKFCGKAIVVDNGEILHEGSSDEVAERYISLNATRQKAGDYSGESSSGTEINFRVLDSTRTSRNLFKPKDDLIIEAKVTAGTQDIRNPRVGIVIANDMGQIIMATNTTIHSYPMKTIKSGTSKSIFFELNNIFTDGVYTLSGAVTDNKTEVVFARKHGQKGFVVSGWRQKTSLVHPDLNIFAE